MIFGRPNQTGSGPEQQTKGNDMKLNDNETLENHNGRRWVTASESTAQHLIGLAAGFKDRGEVAVLELLRDGQVVKWDYDWDAKIRLAREKPAPVQIKSFESSTGICEGCGYGTHECFC